MKKLTELKMLCIRAQFGDWWYIRSGTLLTTKAGEKAFKRFIEGKTVTIHGYKATMDMIPMLRERRKK